MTRIWSRIKMLVYSSWFKCCVIQLWLLVTQPGSCLLAQGPSNNHLYKPASITHGNSSQALNVIWHSKRCFVNLDLKFGYRSQMGESSRAGEQSGQRNGPETRQVAEGSFWTSWSFLKELFWVAGNELWHLTFQRSKVEEALTQIDHNYGTKYSSYHLYCCYLTPVINYRNAKYTD